MISAPARDVRRLYDRRAPFYDALVFALSLGRDGRYRDQAIRALQAESDGRILDVGCGTGLNFPRLPAAFGMDPSQGILRIARNRCARLCAAEAQQIPARNNSFDRVLSTYVLTTTSDWQRCLAEMIRVLRPGGRLVVSDDRLPPGWFLGPGPMLRTLWREGWQDSHRDILDEMKRSLREVRCDYLHGGLIYILSGTKE